MRTAEGCEGVTGAIIRACIRVGGRSPGGLQALLGAPMTVCDGPGGQDEEGGHGRNRSRTVVARVCGDLGCALGGSVANGCRQAGSGMARSRARARPNFSCHGQLCGRCRVRRRAERVIRPAREKNRRRRVLVVATCSPRAMRAVQRARYAPSPVSPARRRWRRSGPTEDGSAPRRTSGPGWRSRPRRGGGDRPPAPGSPRPGR